MTRKIGVLLTNTGTPDAPTTPAVRCYLREFLSDKRVVNIPHLVWLPILHLLILPFRSRKSAALYQKIWLEHDSPMRHLMNELTQKTQSALTESGHEMVIECGMNYGNPSIPSALEKLRQQQIDELIVLPLYPQYSNTTTASTFDISTAALQTWPALPAIKMIRDYATHPGYIAALAASTQRFWQTEGERRHLLISFHGLPKRFVEAGDPYATHCEQTAKLLAAALNLDADQWTLCYQSQFGYDKWLQPSTQALINTLPGRGIKEIDVICPGFSVDCLETLEEIAKRGHEDFIIAGGTKLRMIPALNDGAQHVDLLKSIILG